MKLEYSMRMDASQLANDFAENFVNLWNEGNWKYEGCWDDALMEELDNSLIYYEEQWEILKEYSTPMTANWDEAMKLYLDDIYSCINELE